MWVLHVSYGQEHYAQQKQAIDHLMQLNEKADFCWTPKTVFHVWGELSGRWCEELRMIRAKMLELMGDDNLTCDRIRMACTSPGPDGRWLPMAEDARHLRARGPNALSIS